MINYYLITKPGIILGNLFTVAAGFMLASKGYIPFALFLATMLGLTLIMASACIFNNYIDISLDEKMKRTKNRAFVTGEVKVWAALMLATALVLLGGLVLLKFTNMLAFLIAMIGFVVYVLLYSLWKSKTVYGTAIGSIAGAVPPVVGYVAVKGDIDMGAILLFTVLVMWQMPHFFAIALLHFDDYSKAGIPVLPISRGIKKTKVHMFIYIILFSISAALFTLFGYTGYIYLLTILMLSSIWLMAAYKGFSCTNDYLWGKKMFRLSLVIIGFFCILIPLDKV